MSSLLKKVKAKLSIEVHSKVRGLLEGQYGSVFKGRSMDFEDLREYIPGDDIKDIDWKATARSGQTRIRRYVAIRKHNILFVVDGGRNMAAASASGVPKRDIAVEMTGIISSIAQQHGDLVAMVTGNNDSTTYIPLKSSDAHIERMLQHLNTIATPDAPASNFLHQLEYVTRSIRRRMMIIIIADEFEFTAAHEQLIRRLRVQHELLWLTIADLDLATSAATHHSLIDSDTNIAYPDFLVHHPSVIEAFTTAKEQRQQAFAKQIERLQITHQFVEDDTQSIRAVMKLLEKQKHARR